jgi:hypothetical protein
LLLLGKLYRTYVNLRIVDRSHPLAEDEDESHPITSIINSIEKRWERADQDLFIIALFLNPLINANLFNSSVLWGLPDASIFVYSRLMIHQQVSLAKSTTIIAALGYLHRLHGQ